MPNYLYPMIGSIACFGLGAALSIWLWRSEQTDEPTDEQGCHWCTNDRQKTDLNFTIIDDNSGQYVPYYSIQYCPFCGRSVREDDSD